MVSDPIGDLLIQIKNAGLAGRQSVSLPYSRQKMAIAKILQKEGYIADVQKIGTDPYSKLQISLQYHNKSHAITDVRRRSKPSLRVYVKRNKIPLVVGGLGAAIISTPQGIMTGRDAKKKKLGGELICEIW